MSTILYLANTTAQTVPANGTVNPGAVIRRTAQSQATLSGTSIALSGTGYFAVDVSATFSTPAAAGDVTLVLAKDGVAIPGAIATVTVGSTTATASAAFSCEVRNGCCCNGYSTLTLLNVGTAAEFSNVAIRVKRDA